MTDTKIHSARLKEIVAESIYLNDAHHNPILPFSKQDSNVRDSYFRQASKELPVLLAGYFRQGNNQKFYHLLSGCIDDFINTHGETLTTRNKHSLVKRIVSRFPEFARQMFTPRQNKENNEGSL